MSFGSTTCQISERTRPLTVFIVELKKNTQKYKKFINKFLRVHEDEARGEGRVPSEVYKKP